MTFRMEGCEGIGRRNPRGVKRRTPVPFRERGAKGPQGSPERGQGGTGVGLGMDPRGGRPDARCRRRPGARGPGHAGPRGTSAAAASDSGPTSSRRRPDPRSPGRGPSGRGGAGGPGGAGGYGPAPRSWRVTGLAWRVTCPGPSPEQAGVRISTGPNDWSRTSPPGLAGRIGHWARP